MSDIRVFILVTSQEDVALANSICDTISSKFMIPHASVRSADVPLDRLSSVSIGTVDPSPMPPKVLWVLLKNSNTTKGCHGGAAAASELSDPMLELDVSSTTSTTSSKAADDLGLTIAKFCSLASPALRRVVQKFVTAQRQAKLVDDAQLHTQSPTYQKAIAHCFDSDQQITGDGIVALKDKRMVGKVRDRYQGETKLALVTTDRQSGFDRQLAKVPFKGAVLNLTSAFWFEKTKHIIPNHLLSVPHPNVSIVKKCQPFPIEFVVRYVL